MASRLKHWFVHDTKEFLSDHKYITLEILFGMGRVDNTMSSGLRLRPERSRDYVEALISYFDLESSVEPSEFVDNVVKVYLRGFAY